MHPFAIDPLHDLIVPIEVQRSQRVAQPMVKENFYLPRPESLTQRHIRPKFILNIAVILNGRKEIFCAVK
jgi:hypothetical protein